MRRVRHVFLLAIGVALAVTMAVVPGGCSRPNAERSSVDRPIGDDTLARALRATRAVDRGRMEVTTTVTGLADVPDPPPGGRVTVALHRVAFDQQARRVAVETDVSGIAGALGVGTAGGAGGAAPWVDLSVPARMVAVGDTVYAQAGPMAGALGRAPGDWVQIDPARVVDQGPGNDTAALVLDPLGPFDVVGDAGADVRRVGDAEVRGTPVTHVVARVGSDRGSGAAALDVWIDAEGLIRRLQLRLGSGSAVAAGELVTTVELFDIGAPVDIAPPAGADR